MLFSDLCTLDWFNIFGCRSCDRQHKSDRLVEISSFFIFSYLSRNAKKDYIETTSRLQVASGVLDKMNKDYLKAKKVSPDGILQLAIQV